MKKKSLKLLPNQPPANRLLWEKILRINLQLIKDRMMLKHGWLEERTDEAIALYQVYIFLTQVYQKSISPSEDVDAIWHEHILHTNKYELDCLKTFGKFLHHFPTPAKWAKQTQAKDKASFCCDNPNCCNDDPRTAPINENRSIQVSECEGTTNCGNGYPTDCAKLKPQVEAVLGKQLAINVDGLLIEGTTTLKAPMAQSLHGIMDIVNYDNPQKGNTREITFFKEVISNFFNT